MIDTDEYKGHNESIKRWQMFSHALTIWADEADKKLIADAPLLLEEVKRLQAIISVFDEYMMNDFMTDFSRSEAHAIWNELVRGDGI